MQKARNENKINILNKPRRFHAAVCNDSGHPLTWSQLALAPVR